MSTSFTLTIYSFQTIFVLAHRSRDWVLAGWKVAGGCGSDESEFACCATRQTSNLLQKQQSSSQMFSTMLHRSTTAKGKVPSNRNATAGFGKNDSVENRSTGDIRRLFPNTWAEQSNFTPMARYSCYIRVDFCFKLFTNS